MCALVNYNIAEAEAAWTELSKVDGGRKGCVTSGGSGSGSRLVELGSNTICFYNLLQFILLLFLVVTVNG